MALFENYDRRIDKINGVLKQYSIDSAEACRPSASKTRAGHTPSALPSP